MRPPRARHEEGLLVIKIDDPAALNDGTTAGLRQALFRLIPEETGPRVAADIAAVESLTSSGIALLIGLKRRVEERQGRLVLLRTRPAVLEQFRVMKLADFFQFADDLPGAIELLPPAPSF